MADNIDRAIRVKALRAERGWSQDHLAFVAGVNIRTIQRLEKDGSARHETLMAVAQAFGMEVKQLSSPPPADEAPSPQKPIHLMPRLESGTDLAGVIRGAEQFQFEHDDDDDPRSVGAMRDIMVELKYDVVRWSDSSPIERPAVEKELTQEIQGLAGYGYYLFGIRRVIPRLVDGQTRLTSMATIYMSHSRSPRLVRDNAFMVIPAILTEVAG
ncbi:MAG: helix-turn-helix domain-containing protein [Gammaproteobacteria bacterium]|nr:helix-turn-helix domain-containing protein [Gammaproteobacteria bacterium]